MFSSFQALTARFTTSRHFDYLFRYLVTTDARDLLSRQYPWTILLSNGSVTQGAAIDDSRYPSPLLQGRPSTIHKILRCLFRDSDTCSTISCHDEHALLTFDTPGNDSDAKLTFDEPKSRKSQDATRIRYVTRTPFQTLDPEIATVTTTVSKHVQVVPHYCHFLPTNITD